jgi:cation:H+ antiporter
MLLPMNSIPPSLIPWLQHPLALLLLFMAASAVMVWRLDAIEHKGLEGTIVGTLIMPYCSGAANLAFAFVMGHSAAADSGRLVMENSIINNLTNLTLILGLAALISSSATASKKTGRVSKSIGVNRQSSAQRIDRLNLLLTLIALFMFTGALWVLGRDGLISFSDALILVGLFLFWQVLHIFEVLKTSARRNQAPHGSIVFDLLIVAACTWAVYHSVDQLVGWVTQAQNRYVTLANLGWLSGCLMVLPNALLAAYYAYKGRNDIVVSSQVGDGHICIPMCIGLFALFQPIVTPEYFETGLLIILAAGAVQFICIATVGRLPALFGWALAGVYAGFMYAGVIA